MRGEKLMEQTKNIGLEKAMVDRLYEHKMMLEKLDKVEVTYSEALANLFKTRDEDFKDIGVLLEKYDELQTRYDKLVVEYKKLSSELDDLDRLPK